jgi:hypothetical protein
LSIFLSRYVDVQAKEIGYDLEANLALLKLYQFNQGIQNMGYVCKILLKVRIKKYEKITSYCESS